MIYAGIGSRETPSDVLALFMMLGYNLAWRGHTLRSGHAPGADQAFEKGALKVIDEGREPLIELYLPWQSFEGGSDYATRTEPTDEAAAIAAEYHPRWQYLTQGAKKLMARNSHQVLGPDLNDPVHVIVCWTPGKGGTEQALRIAERSHIFVINAYDECDRELLDWANRYPERFVEILG